MSYASISVEDRHGNRQVIFLPSPADAPQQVRAITDQLVDDLVATLDLHPDDAASLAITLLVQQEHDEAAYRRVCERRGVLAL